MYSCFIIYIIDTFVLLFHPNTHMYHTFLNVIMLENPRKYRVIFKVKSREEPRQVLKNLSQQLEHKQVPKRDGTRCLEG